MKLTWKGKSNMRLLIEIIKEYGWIIGTIGGVLGIVSFAFSAYDFKERHVTLVNKEIFQKYISIGFDECFKDYSASETENINLLRVTTLISKIDGTKNSFKGICARFYYYRLRNLAIPLNKKFKDEFIPFLQVFDDPQKDTVIASYQMHSKEIMQLKSLYIKLYKCIFKINL